ncbi:MAG: carbohydrate ABC transporter permease [Erysipelotrichaceae bacterium]
MRKKMYKFRCLPISDQIAYICIYALLLALILITLYPLFFVLCASFLEPVSLQTDGINFNSGNMTLYGYKQVLSNPMILRGFFNSILYSFSYATLQVVLCMTFAYPLTQKKLKGRKFLSGLMIFTMFFGGGLIPTYLLIKNIGMLDTPWAVVIPTAFSVWNVILARTFINGIPNELDEASKIDGTSHFQYFFKILIPLSKPRMMVIFLYAFVSQWNSYFDAMIYIDNDKLQPLQLVLRQILVQNDMGATSNYTLQQDMAQLAQMAATVKYSVIVISSLPLLVLYPFFQKYFDIGVMLGSL